MRSGEVKTNRWVVTRIQKIADVKYERSQNAENFIEDSLGSLHVITQMSGRP